MARRLAFVRPRTDAAPRRTMSVGLLRPLDALFGRAGVATPEARQIAPDEIPLPHRTLLVHERSMTRTLEEHHGCRVVLRVLGAFTRGRTYFRHVLLARDDSGRPLAMGAIGLTLDALPPRVRAAVRRAGTPVGRLFAEHGVRYVSRPIAFLELVPNSAMMGVFWMREPAPLYGRRTDVRLGGKKIGDILEILPPE